MWRWGRRAKSDVEGWRIPLSVPIHHTIDVVIRRVAGWLRTGWQWEPFRRSAILFCSLRIGLSLWAVLTLAVVPAETGPSTDVRPYFDIAPVDEGWAGALLGPWQRFDTLHYIRLASRGYEPGTPHTVFPPLYPLLIRALGGLLGRRYLLAALVVSNASALGYLLAFFALAHGEVGPAAARKSQVYAALFPWAFFLLAGYAEPLFLFLAALAFWTARRGRTWPAGLCGALAALTRLQGGLLALPLFFETMRRRKFRLLPLRPDLLAPLLPVLASGGFLLGRAWAGLEPISDTYATHWHQTPAFPGAGLVTILRHMRWGIAHPTDRLDFVVGCLFVVLTVVAWCRLRQIYALYMTAALLFTLSYQRLPHPLSGIGRHTMELFPAFFLLGEWGERSPWRHRLILYPSLALFVYLSAQFVLWGWVG